MDEKTDRSNEEYRGTILFVDDEEMVLDAGLKVLRRLGYRVFGARGGEEAIGLYRENKDIVDMVILDMVMPDMSGGEAFDRIKEIKHDVKVLLSSGYGIDTHTKEILDRGASAFIQKPFGMDALSGKIKEVLGIQVPLKE